MVILAWHHVIFDALKKRKKIVFILIHPPRSSPVKPFALKITCLYYVYVVMIQKGDLKNGTYTYIRTHS